MTPPNYDLVVFDSRLPAFRNRDSDSFTVSVSGNVGAGATATWSGNTTFTSPARMVRYSMSQTVIPSGAGYSAIDRLPVALMVGGSNISPYIGCSVSGDPSVTSIAPNIYITSTQNSATCTVSITNPNAGTMTLTATTLTIYYTAFEVFGES